MDPHEILDLCPNSVFKDRTNVSLSDYYTIEGLNNLKIKNTPENILLIHINAVSLSNFDNFNDIVNTLAIILVIVEVCAF